MPRQRQYLARLLARAAETDRCQSGRSGSPGKRVNSKMFRGFESLSVRHFKQVALFSGQPWNFGCCPV